MCREAVAQVRSARDRATNFPDSPSKLWVFDKEIKAGPARRSSLIAVPVPDVTFLKPEHGRLVLSAKDTKQRQQTFVSDTILSTYKQCTELCGVEIGSDK